MLIPVILSGGAGTRLWSISREGHPKPCVKLTRSKNLMLETCCRAAAVTSEGDCNDNRTQGGEALFVGSHSTSLQSEGRVAATVGVEDLIIVDTFDARLVIYPSKAPDVNKVVTQPKKMDRDAYRLHPIVKRFERAGAGLYFKLRRSEVKAANSLNLQMRHDCSEQGIVVNGMTKVANCSKEIFVRVSESVYISVGHKHCMEDPGVTTDVPSGEYLGRDGAPRLQDISGRA